MVVAVTGRAGYTTDQDDERVITINHGGDRYDGDDGGGGGKADVAGHGRDDVHGGGRPLQPRLQREFSKSSADPKSPTLFKIYAKCF